MTWYDWVRLSSLGVAVIYAGWVLWMDGSADIAAKLNARHERQDREIRWAEANEYVRRTLPDSSPGRR